jgi:hypothetical protein
LKRADKPLEIWIWQKHQRFLGIIWHGAKGTNDLEVVFFWVEPNVKLLFFSADEPVCGKIHQIYDRTPSSATPNGRTSSRKDVNGKAERS